MLLPTHHFIVWCVAVGVALYGTTWAGVMLANVRAERERGWADRILQLATEAGHDGAMALPGRRAPLSASLLVLQGPFPLVVREAIARGLVKRIGVSALRHAPRWRHPVNQSRWRIAALTALVLGDRDNSWDLLEAAIVDSDPEVAAAAVTLAGQLPDSRAAAILVAALRAGRHTRSRVATALDLFPMSVGDLIAPLIDERDPTLRYWGAVLMRRYPRHPALAAALPALARDENPLVRKAAIDAAAAVEGDGGLAVAQHGLDDPVPFVRAHAVQAMAARDGATAVSSIASLLADTDWGVRAAAKKCLVRLGPGPVEAILPFLRHPDDFVRRSAAEVLQDVGEFERLLMLEVEGAPNPAHRDTIQLIAAAGGADMRRAVLEHLRPDARRTGEALLTRLVVANAT